MENREEFTKLMEVMAEMYDKELSDNLMDIYWDFLSPYPDIECVDAFKKVMGMCRWWPKPVDFLVILKNDDPPYYQEYEKIE